ncbi:hypothetical protein DFH06DRAFT_1147997 [Mycena polygramma]|nr:hypothetical protein DFH06DRAFT_1147997 [Mycena polygramma]
MQNESATIKREKEVEIIDSRVRQLHSKNKETVIIRITQDATIQQVDDLLLAMGSLSTSPGNHERLMNSAPRLTFEAAMESRLVHPMHVQRPPRQPLHARVPLWRTISPYRNIPSHPQPYISNIVEDYLFRPLKAIILDHEMPWGTRGYELVTFIPGKLSSREVLHCAGAVSGRWVVDNKMFDMKEYGCTLVRVLNRQNLWMAAIAVPCDKVDMLGTPDYEEQLKEAFLDHARRERDEFFATN